MPNHKFMSGDSVVYPGHGLGTVVGMKSEIVCNQDTELLVVSLETGLTLRLPVRNIAKSGLRRVSSHRVMDDALGVLRDPPARKKPMWRRRALEYAAKIKSGDPRAIAEIVRDLHRPAGQAEASFSEKAVYQQALDHLIPEVAAVDRTDNAAAAKKIVRLLEAA